MNVECAICFEALENGQDISVVKCGHVFHTACVTNWIKPNKTCPKCRMRCTEANLVKLFIESAVNPTPDRNQTRARIVDLQTEMLALQSLMQEQSDRISELEQQNATVKREKEAAVKNKDAEAAVERKKYLEKITSLKKSVQDLRKENDDFSSMKKLLSNSESIWKRELEDYSSGTKADPRSLCIVLAEVKRQLQEAEAKAKSTRAFLRNEHNTAAAEYRAKLNAKTAEVERLQAELSVKNQEIEELREKFEALEAVSRSNRHRPADVENIPISSQSSRSTTPASSANETIVLSDDSDDCGYATPAVVRARAGAAPARGDRVGFDGMGGRGPLENPRSFGAPAKRARQSVRPKSKSRCVQPPLQTIDNMLSN